ncbi:unnamed protein product [Prorocentrum cordatum]|uniref:Fanconi-associated nuclease n=1 Tax=Prorocentrum cordatum TaxID=2364126 RepID=A0ABN9XJF2_9DINO|nr:unnamed protein product [Polarella glacialis]
MTREWMLQQVERERVDPRENPNLLIDESHQEFWNTAARKPYARALLRAEQHWTRRRGVWLRQVEAVEGANATREEVAELLEDCSAEAKRLVAPILHFRITEVALWTVLREAREHDQPSFAVALEQPHSLELLRCLRLRIDLGGERAAAGMMDEFCARARRCMEESHERTTEKGARGRRFVEVTDVLARCLNWAQKCQKDGHIEWYHGNAEEALAAWRQADACLRHLRAPPAAASADAMIARLHAAVLKNLAQAALRLGCWTEALQAADDALQLDDRDHKAQEGDKNTGTYNESTIPRMVWEILDASRIPT